MSNLENSKFAILKIPKISNFENFKNFQLGKFQNFLIPQKIVNLRLKICILENSKNFQSEKFQKFAILKIPKISTLENSKKLAIWKIP